MPTGLEFLAQAYAPRQNRVREPVPSLREIAEPDAASTDIPPEDILPKNQGAFLSFLNWVGRPGQVVKNVLTGNLEGAGRQALDFGADFTDAMIPFVDAIPEFSRKQDYVEGSQVLGLDDQWRKENPLLNLAASLPVDILTDPLTFTGFAPIVKGATAVGKGAASAISKIPKGAGALSAIGKQAEKGGMALRSITGSQRLNKTAEEALNAAGAAKVTEAQAGISAIKGSKALASLSDDEAKIVGDIMDNMQWQGRTPTALVPGLQGPGGASALSLVTAHPGVTPDNVDRIRAAVQDAIEIGQNQAKRPGIFSGGVPDEYLGRKYTGQSEQQAIDEVLGGGAPAMGAPGAAKARSLKTPEDIASFLAANPGVEYERNALSRLAQRATTQGQLAGRAEVGRKLLGQAFTLTDDAQRSQVVDAIEKMAASADPIDRESAKALKDAFSGMAPRGPITDVLSRVNRVVKPMMVYGYAIPKFGAIVRNKIGGIWQALSTPGTRGVAGEQLKRFPSDMYGAVVDSLGLKVPKDRLGQAMEAVDAAFMASKGAADNAAQILASGPGAGGYTGQQLASLLKSGALQGFVSSEDLLKTMASSPKAKTWKSITEWPARMFKGVEDRMRGGMYLDLLAKGTPEADAAKFVNEALYSYDISSAGNRAARDVLPFAQFTFKAIPQQAKLLNEKPWLAVALSSLLTEKEGQATYPYMEGKLNIPLGEDEQGNQTYASGLGLPFEALTMIPNPSGSIQSFGRDLGRTLVGSSQPLLKTAGAAAFGVDPMFQSPFGSYSKLPGNIEGGAAGRAYNILAGAGLTQPVESPLRLLGKLADDRGSAGTKALDLLTGANIVSVDPDRALQQRLTSYLQRNPEVASIQTLYSKTNDPEAQALIQQLREVKKRLAEKRKASAPAP